MSSIRDQNILYNFPSNRKTITIDIDLENGLSRNVDLTKAEFGNLDFTPHIVRPLYICYSSKKHSSSHDIKNYLNLLTCNFINEANILCPFYDLQTIQSFNNLEYNVKQNLDIRNVNLSVKYLYNNKQNDTPEVNNIELGNLLVGLEFVRYMRNSERIMW